MNPSPTPSFRQRLTRRLAVLATLAAALVVVAPATGADAATCKTWTFIGIPGSGQGRAHTGGGSDNNNYGAQVARVKQRFVARKGSSRVATYAINYPAKIGFAGTGYSGSVDKGVAETKRIIKNVAASCPSTRFVIAGYSQGAHVGTLVLGAIPVSASKVYRAAFMGNPLYKDGSTNSREAPSGSVTRSGIFNAGRNWQSRWNGKVRDVCIDKDLVCEALSTTSTTNHLAYNSRYYPGTSTYISNYLGYNWLAG